MAESMVIIGGGLAGLYAAYLLQQRGEDFILLEADDRLGGRILSEPHSANADNQLKLDLGPAWFWPHQTEMIELTQSLQIDTFKQYNVGDALYQADAHSAIERFKPSYMESYRVAGGMQRIIDKLAQALPVDAIKLNTRITDIKLVNDAWQINHNRGTCSAKRLIIAAAPRVIVDKIEMPDSNLVKLFSQLRSVPTWMAAQAKFVASYASPFWRDMGLSGQAFSRQGPMVEIHDASATQNDGFALFGFIGVPANNRKEVKSEVLKQACTEQLVSIFGDQASHLEISYLVDWAENDLIASEADLHEQAAHPHIDLQPYRQSLIDHQLYFGNSEVSTQDPGYLRGALVAASTAVDALIG